MTPVGAQNLVSSDLVEHGVKGQEKKVTVLRVDYGPELGADAGASLNLSKDLISEYESRNPDREQPEPNAQAKEEEQPKDDAQVKEEKQPEDNAQEKKPEKTTTPSCVIVLNAKAAGSPLLKALYNLYQHVFQQGGQVKVVGFPPDFIALLNSTGLTSFRGFSLVYDVPTALRQIVEGEREETQGS